MSNYLESLFGLKGKTALVTGGTRGIGQSMAIALARAGADIILVQRDTSNKETSDKIQSIGVRVEVVVCDLNSSSEVKNLVRKVVDSPKEGGLGMDIDILVNCGGIQRRAPAENFTDEDWGDVLQVNLSTVWTLARDVGRHMLQRREGLDGEAVLKKRGRGKIINIASLLSFQGGLTAPAYAAAKHGVLGLGKALSNEWSKKHINVNSIAPGYIATDMNKAILSDSDRSRQIFERIPIGRWGKPDDFEGAIVFLASPASDYVCGECLTVDGGWMSR